MVQLPEKRKKIVILGAGGRDFHNFNVLYRDDPTAEVVAFTATQIPFQQGRRYPAALAGPFYPDGIPILGEERLPFLIQDLAVTEVLFAYSDIHHQALMELASKVLALGADFRMAGPRQTMLPAAMPVLSVCAVRTGCGKSPVTRYLCRLLRELGRQPVVVRHPMAYGRLDIRAAERFVSLDDLARYQCTIEEREEYEPLISLGVPLLAGVDYGQVLAMAQREGDVLIWDGGNNDFSFFAPDLEIVLVDPLRAGHETTYYPGMVNLLRADVLIMGKCQGASGETLEQLRQVASRLNPQAQLVEGELEVSVEDGSALAGKRVVVVEDGPTLTHGGMSLGAGTVAARRYGVSEMVDPRPFATGSLQDTFRQYRHLQKVVPAMGYSDGQVAELQALLDAVPCDLVLNASPVDLARLMKLGKPVVRARYEFAERHAGGLKAIVAGALAGKELS